MNIFRINNNFKKKINIEIKKCNNELIFKNKYLLTKKKCEIDNYNTNDWDKSKKYINNYEYIYTSSDNNKNICNIRPISRSYFKIYEILKNYKILNNNDICCCICEGPGGFIQCLNNNYQIKKVYGITLIKKYDKSIPFWNKKILLNNQNFISFGEDNTGNIYHLKNCENFIQMINNNNYNNINLVTSDGGFDYSKDYNNQEDLSYHLILCEIYISLNVQKLCGNFIIKIFDLFNYKTIQLIYLLYNCYDKIEFFKPTTSRLSNSEKYLICLNFQGIEQNELNKIKENFNNYQDIYINIPNEFINNINEYNEIFMNNQINEINKIIKNIKNKNDYPRKEQITNAKKWCELYNLPINKNCIYL